MYIYFAIAKIVIVVGSLTIFFCLLKLNEKSLFTQLEDIPVHISEERKLLRRLIKEERCKIKDRGVPMSGKGFTYRKGRFYLIKDGKYVFVS